MKRVLSLILVLTLCIGLCACGDMAAAKKAIVGEWYATDSDANYVVFNSDGTGKRIADNTDNFKWKYDRELECYTLLFNSSVSATIQEKDGMKQLTINETTYVRSEDHEQVYGKYLDELQKQQEKLREEGNNIVKKQLHPESKQLEAKKKYTHTNGLTFTVETIEKTTESLPSGSKDVVWLTIAFDDDANKALLNEEIRIEGGFYHGTNFFCKQPINDSILEEIGSILSGYRLDPLNPEKTTCYHYKKYLPQGVIRFPIAVYGDQGIQTFEEEIYGDRLGFIRIHIDNVIYHILAKDLPPITN